MTLVQFVQSICAPAGSVPLKSLLNAYHTHTGKQLGRSQAIAELTKHGFVIGEANKVLSVGGISLPLAWTVVDGQLVQA